MQIEDIIHLLFIGIIAVIARAPCLSGDFIHDDFPHILWNQDVINNESNWTSLFSNDILGQTLKSWNKSISQDLYKPLTILTYRLNYIFLGSSSFYFHVVNTIVQSINCWLVYFVVKKLENSSHIALLSTSIFSAHPILTETVCGLASRGNLLSGFFTLIALLVYEKQSILAILMIIFGIFAKEDSILTILLIILVEIIREKKIIKTLFVYGSFLALVLSLRYNYFSKSFKKTRIEHSCTA